MSTIVTIREASADLPRLIEQVRASEEVVISKNGDPWVRLCPLEKPPRRRAGLLKGELGEGLFEPLPNEELEAWE